MSDHASRCKAIREAQGLSQNGFARIIGTTQATIDNWEKGRIPNGPAQLILMIASTAKGFKIVKDAAIKISKE